MAMARLPLFSTYVSAGERVGRLGVAVPVPVGSAPLREMPSLTAPNTSADDEVSEAP